MNTKGRSVHVECRAEGCVNGTSEGKSFCLYHLFSMPYAAAVYLTLRARRELGDHRRDMDLTPLRGARRAAVAPPG